MESRFEILSEELGTRTAQAEQRYLLLFAGDEQAWARRPEAERAGVMEAIGRWWERLRAIGVIEVGYQLAPSTAARVVTRTDAAQLVEPRTLGVLDGVLGGFAVIRAASLEEAVRIASTWPAPDAVEVRPIIDPATDAAA